MECFVGAGDGVGNGGVCVVRVCGDGGLSGAARRSVTVPSWRRRATPDKTKTSVALLPSYLAGRSQALRGSDGSPAG